MATVGKFHLPPIETDSQRVSHYQWLHSFSAGVREQLLKEDSVAGRSVIAVLLLPIVIGVLVFGAVVLSIAMWQ